MDLFQVPGWPVPTSVSNSNSAQHDIKKKRKRLQPNSAESSRFTSTRHHGERPVKRVKFKSGASKLDRKKVEDERVKPVAGVYPNAGSSGTTISFAPKLNPPLARVPGVGIATSTQPGRFRDKGGKRASAHADNPPSSNASKLKNTSSLTALQSNFKQNLDGARFRWLNVQLYNANSTDAHRMMRKDPKFYEEYHVGFRLQVQSWPANPVSYYISKFSTWPQKTVIADLGCGDAALARALIPKGMTVLSFDLVSDGAFVIEADICGPLPLPGAEDSDEGHVVDVVVCSLSLMPSNWLDCIREAWRVLKPGGEIHIAEVASRFIDVENFISLICSIGFRLLSKDESNTHFTLFEWRKISRKPKTELDWARLAAKSNVLKPCEYKRR